MSTPPPPPISSPSPCNFISASPPSPPSSSAASAAPFVLRGPDTAGVKMRTGQGRIVVGSRQDATQNSPCLKKRHMRCLSLTVPPLLCSENTGLHLNSRNPMRNTRSSLLLIGASQPAPKRRSAAALLTLQCTTVLI